MVDDYSIWTALADSKRRQIIILLDEKPRTTSELSKYFDVSRFAVMKHLNVLERAKLINVKREGRNRWNILNEELTHFLRTKQNDDDGLHRILEIMGVFPGKELRAGVSLGSALAFHQVEQSILLPGPPHQIFKALTVEIDAWWSERAEPRSQVWLEPFINGRFYESFNTIGHGILYATVTKIKQDEELQLRGTMGLGARMADGIAPDGLLRIVLEPEENGTRISLRHHFIGSDDETVSDICRRHWNLLLNQNLRLYLEEGIPFKYNP